MAYAVIQAYHTLLPQGRYPMALIFIEMDPADVDVNVHPTKAEVRFRDNHAVFSAVQRAVRRTLTDQAPIPQVGLGSAAPATSPGEPAAAWDGRPGPFSDPAWAERWNALRAAGSDQRQLFTVPGFDAASTATSAELAAPNRALTARSRLPTRNTQCPEQRGTLYPIPAPSCPCSASSASSRPPISSRKGRMACT